MANSTKLGLEITGDNTGAIKALKGVESELGKVDAKTKDTAKSSSGLSTALKGVALGAGLKVAIGEYEDAEKVARQTEAAIKSTGNAAEISAKQQNDMADSLSKIAAVDDEVISGGANLLRTFTNVRGEAFEPTLQAALDLSAVLGTDLNANVTLLGKALQDPEKGLSRLTRAGVVFTDQQKEQIKTLQESGDVLGAQNVILAEVQKEFGGQAEAAATSTDRMKVAMGNAAESAGYVLAPAFEKVAEGTSKAAEAFSALPKPLQGVVLAGAGAALVGPRIVDGFAKVGDSVKVVKGWGSSLTGASKAAEGLEGSAAGAAGGASKLGLAMGAIGAAGAAFALYEASKAANKFTFDAEKAAKVTDEQLLADLSKLAQIEPGILKKLDLETLYRLRDVAKEAGAEIPGLGAAIKDVEGKEKQAAKTHSEYGAEVDKVKAGAEVAKTSIGGLGDAFDGLSESVGGVSAEFDKQTEAMQANEKQTQDSTSAAFAAFDAEAGYANALAGTTSAVNELNTARAAGNQAEIAAKERDLGEAIKDEALARGEQIAKQYEANGATLTAAQVAGIQRDEMDKARATTGYWSTDLQALRDRLDAAANSAANLAVELAALAVQEAASNLGTAFSDAFGLRKRARGGPVAPGESVIVGDGGRPEVFTAGPTGGHVFPDASKFSGGGVTSTINVYGTVDPATVAEMVAARQGRDLRRMALV